MGPMWNEKGERRAETRRDESGIDVGESAERMNVFEGRIADAGWEWGQWIEWRDGNGERGTGTGTETGKSS